MEISDPLRAMVEHDDQDDLFKSSFKGTAGVIKITSQNKNEAEQENSQEKFDVPKPVMTDKSPDDDDLFSDCRSEFGSEADRSCSNISNLNKSTIRRQSYDQESPPSQQTNNSCNRSSNIETSIRDKLNIGRGHLHNHHHLQHADDPGEEFLQVEVSDPHKVGEGMSSYMAYRVITKTNLRCFRRQSITVNRRYSDFLTLHEKLVARYQSKGRIIPPAPEKNLLGATRVKMGSSGNPGAVETNVSNGASLLAMTEGSHGSHQCKAHFISRRCAALERFINRVALHPVLRLDSDFVDFLECDGEMPRLSSASAISSASVFKMITRVGETVNKIAYKMEEGDTWFEEKTLHVEQMETQLKKLYNIVENVVTCRRELAFATGQFATSVGLLATSEEAFHLARSLEGLSRTEEKVEMTLQEQADADFAYILELIRDYLALVNAVKEVMGERVRAFLAWQNAVNTLHKKREQRSRMELGGRLDKMGTAIEDVTEWEHRVEDLQDAFQKISEVIKVEMELFQHYRVADFKDIIVIYLEDVNKSQQDMVNHWEGFLLETKRVM